MKTPLHFAALARQAAARNTASNSTRTSPKLSHGFAHAHAHSTGVPSIQVIPASPTREAAAFVWSAAPARSADSFLSPGLAAGAPRSREATGARRKAVSFLASRTGKRDGPPGTIKTSTTPAMSSIDEVVTVSEQSLVTNQVAVTSPTADASTWPSLHFASCACETCDPSNSTAPSRSTPFSISRPAPAERLPPSATSLRAQPAPRRASVADASGLRKKALRQVMQRKLKGRSLGTSSTSQVVPCAAYPAAPSIVLSGPTLLIESEAVAAARARLEGEWHIRWLATEYLRREAGHSF